MVAVSIGGWAGSSISVMHSDDDGVTWSVPKRLITTPLLNLSTLVKGSGFLFADGTMGIRFITSGLVNMVSSYDSIRLVKCWINDG